MTELLVAENLTRHYRVRTPGGLFGKRATLKAVDGVSFVLGRGRTLGIVGESGCGKSTTASMAVGLIPPTTGRVLFDGEPVSAKQDGRWRRQRCQMQMVFQDPMAALDRHLTVGYQVMEPLIIHKRGTAAERRQRGRELLNAVGLESSYFERHPHELSGGQRQRVNLARALALNPEMLVCDEPVSALDVSVQAQVIDLLTELQQELGLAYLFISHDLKVVRTISDEVAIMYLGRVVEQGHPDVIFDQPEHPYTRGLIEAIPTVRRGRSGRRMVPQGEPPNPVDVPSGCAFRGRCPWAAPLCATVTPRLEVSSSGTSVACHAVHGRIPKKPDRAA